MTFQNYQVNVPLISVSTMKKILLMTLCATLLTAVECLADECRPPTSCVATSECNRRHRDANSDVLSSQLLYRCDPGKVCCPATPTATRIERPRPTPPVRPTPPARPTPPVRPKPLPLTIPSQHKNVKLLPADCGLATSERITQGYNATLGQFPWMALIGIREKKQTRVQHVCGGSLISSLYVLTAAHCVKDPDKTVVHVRLGEHDQSTNPDCEQTGIEEEECAPPVLDVPVTRITPHMRYNSTTLKNDIALLRLATPVSFSTSAYISPICLPFTINDVGAEEKKYWVSGWGKLNGLRTEGSSPLLQWARVSGLSTADCNALQGSPAVQLDSSQLCADDVLGADACQGDSGGPLMDVQKLPSRDMPQTFVIGIVSFGFRNCASQNSPSAYTRVNHYINWILDNISK